MTLYEITGDANWTEKSRNLANLVARWTTSYDYELPAHTELAKRILQAYREGVDGHFSAYADYILGIVHRESLP